MSDNGDVTIGKNGSDGLDGTPWYVRAFVRVGVPTAFAGILLWFLVSNINVEVRDIKAWQAATNQTLQTILQNQLRIMELLGQESERSRDTSALLTAMCYNASANNEERMRCTAALK